MNEDITHLNIFNYKNFITKTMKYCKRTKRKRLKLMITITMLLIFLVIAFNMKIISFLFKNKALDDPLSTRARRFSNSTQKTFASMDFSVILYFFIFFDKIIRVFEG